MNVSYNVCADFSLKRQRSRLLQDVKTQEIAGVTCFLIRVAAQAPGGSGVDCEPGPTRPEPGTFEAGRTSA